MHSATSHPAQSSTHSNLLHQSTCICNLPRLLDSSTGRLFSLFLHTAGRADRQTDAGTLSHVHARARALVKPSRPVILYSATLLNAVGNTKYDRRSFISWEIMSHPHWPAPSGNNLSMEATDRTLSFDEEQHQMSDSRGQGCHWPPPSSERHPIQ